MPRLTQSEWSLVEKDYRAGLLSDRQIAEKYGVSHGSVQQQAKKRGWSRDLVGRSVAKAEEKLAREELASKLATETKVASEKELVDSTSDAMVIVMRGHRKDVGRLRGVVSVLLEKVEAILNESDLFKQIGEVCFSADDNGIDKVNELYRKVIELPTQTDTTKKLAETMKVLIELERKVFKLDTLPEGEDDDAKKAGAEAGRAVAAGVDAAMAALAAKVAEAKAK